MDFVRARHGNAVWHRVTEWEACEFDNEDNSIDVLMVYVTHCTPTGYCTAGEHSEVVTADTVPGRLCRVCAKGMEEAA